MKTSGTRVKESSSYMHKMRNAVLGALLLILIFVSLSKQSKPGSIVEASPYWSGEEDRSATLSPFWGAPIRQWSSLIEREATASGLDPDLIAAVMNAESNGNHVVVSRVGAVGLMGVMPSSPGLEWRPSSESLKDPEINMSWGVAILSEIMRQSGGDIGAALAAYSGGWKQANSRVPMAYADRVLDEYGRAVAVRSNVSPEIASKWTIATEIRRGNVPLDPLILGDQPISGLRKFGEHIVFNTADPKGRAFFIKGFAVPLALVVPVDEANDSSATVDRQILARLGLSETKINNSLPEVIKACLPSLSRLRGELATRWYAPTDCPAWHR